MTGYQTPDVCALTGATFRQLDHWTRKGYVTPSVQVSAGSGHNRRWSFDDAVQIAVMAALVKAGVSPPVAAEFDITAETLRTRAVVRGRVQIVVDVEAIRDDVRHEITARTGAAA